MLGEGYGAKAIAMSDADFRCYVVDVIVESARAYFQDLGEVPTYEEFVEYLEGLLSEELERLKEQGIYEVIYFPPYGEGDAVFISDVKGFIALIDSKYGLKDLYEEIVQSLDLDKNKEPGLKM